MKSFQEYLAEASNNLGDSNSYYEVTGEFGCFVKDGYKPSNASYGSAKIFKPNLVAHKAQPGDEIHNLHGGVFLIKRNGTIHRVFATGEQKGAFERGDIYQKFPTESLRKTDAPKLKWDHSKLVGDE